MDRPPLRACNIWMISVTGLSRAWFTDCPTREEAELVAQDLKAHMPPKIRWPERGVTVSEVAALTRDAIITPYITHTHATNITNLTYKVYWVRGAIPGGKTHYLSLWLGKGENGWNLDQANKPGCGSFRAYRHYSHIYESFTPVTCERCIERLGVPS